MKTDKMFAETTNLVLVSEASFVLYWRKWLATTTVIGQFDA
jgi:hypothetical protein